VADWDKRGVLFLGDHCQFPALGADNTCACRTELKCQKINGCNRQYHYGSNGSPRFLHKHQENRDRHQYQSPKNRPVQRCQAPPKPCSSPPMIAAFRALPVLLDPRHFRPSRLVVLMLIMNFAHGNTSRLCVSLHCVHAMVGLNWIYLTLLMIPTMPGELEGRKYRAHAGFPNPEFFKIEMRSNV
jgi:hypothetical protein